MTEVYIKHNRYGKEQVKFLKKVVEAGKHTVYEFTTLILLRGDFTESYTTGDNANVIPTDTMKNSVYLLAKTHDFSEPEVFAAIVANHFTSLDKFAHVSSAECSVTQHRWSRITMADGSQHDHSFYRDGDELRTASCEAVRGGKLSIKSGIKDLLVLKSTGSSFYGFFRDEWTTLPDVNDRIFSTSVTCTYTWADFDSIEAVEKYSNTFQKSFTDARQTTFEIFATDDSCSVQATMYKMCEKILSLCPGVKDVEYTLPNKHYFNVNMAPFNIKNDGPDATIYMPQAWPSGHINACIARKGEAVLN